jgi:hypothetical protein
MNVLTLAHLTGDSAAGERADRALAQLGARGRDAARVAPFMCAALSTYHAGMRQIVIAGGPDEAHTRTLHDVVASTYLPFTVLVPLAETSDRSRIAPILPFAADMRARDGRGTVYVCHDFRCEAPVHDPDALRALLAPAR